MSIDLHIHSTISDGSYTPEQIIAEAEAKGLTAVSICDHEAVAANEPALAAAAGRLLYIPGVEIGTSWKDFEIHILGYFVDSEYPPLVQELQHVRQQRVERIKRIVRRLQNMGLPILMEDIWEAVKEKKEAETAVGRPHVALALTKKNIVASPAEAFERFLKQGRPAYEKRYRTPLEKALALITQAGGLPVLAHPGLLPQETLIPELVRAGIQGLEAYHTAHTPAHTEHYIAMAQQLGLYITGGTDSHGPLGSYPVELGSLDIPDVYAERLLEWRKQQSEVVTDRKKLRN